MYERFSYLHVCALPSVAGVFSSQKRALDFLELNLQAVINHDMYAGNQSWGICMSNQCSYY